MRAQSASGHCDPRPGTPGTDRPNDLRSKDSGFKFGQSMTLGQVDPEGQPGRRRRCPLLLVGIRARRVDGVELAPGRQGKLDELAVAEEVEREAKVAEQGRTYAEWQRELGDRKRVIWVARLPRTVGPDGRSGR